MSRLTLDVVKTPASVWTLPGHRLAAMALVALFCADSFLGGISIALVIPLTNVMLGGQVTGSGLQFVNDLLQAAGAKLGIPVDATLLLMLFASILIAKAILSLVVQFASVWYGQRLLRGWLNRLFFAYITRDISAAQTDLRGRAVNIVTREAHHAYGFVLNEIGLTVAAIAFLVHLATMSAVNIQVVFVGVVCSAVVYLLVFRPLLKVSHRIGLKSLSGNQGLVERFVQTLSNLRDVQLLQLEEQKLKEMRDHNDALHRLELVFGWVRAAPAASLELFFALGIAAFSVIVVLYGGSGMNAMLGEMAFFLVGTYRLLGFASTMATEWVRCANRKSSFDAMMGELSRLESIPERAGGMPVQDLRSDIEIRNLSYSPSEGELLFDNVSARILRGRINVLYGASGSGKTTLLDFLCRLREPPEATIFANGRDVTTFQHRDWMKLFGYVSQEPKLFVDTLYNNVALGRDGVGAEDVRWALEHAAATEFVSAKTDAGSIHVEEDGANLSGGQRRRIAIARALATRPKVLILDEATQAIEISLEQDLLRGLALTGITVLVVSHRLETADFADQILHLRDGRIEVLSARAALEALPLSSVR
jgi:ATP-binding cassette subfamily C protein